MEMHDDVYQELRVLLETSRDEIDSLLTRLPTLEPVELAARLESLALRDQQRAAHLQAIRNQASQTRRREEERSIRQFVLRALAEIGSPQTAGFLEDYLYANERVVLRTRGFAALRRDENRAWRRRPGHRVAYIVPCLDEEGRAVSRWMARSDWEVRERIAVPGVESLWTWTRVAALCNAWRMADDEADALYFPLVARYAREARGEDGSEVSEELQAPDFAVRLEEEATRAINELRTELAPALDRAAGRIQNRSEEERLWGIGDGVRVSMAAKDD